MGSNPTRPAIGELMFEYEKKWQQRWSEAQIFFPEVEDGKKKKYITAAFPYPNSPQHIGHGRTYTITDVYARFWRMRGYNVLFPMGFHVTGSPIFAMAKRIKEHDKELLDIFEKIYHIPPEKLSQLEDPRQLVLFFCDEIEQGMKEMGYSIDWRRKFYTFDKHFNAFIRWQFTQLDKKGYLKKGSYPIAWCPKCGTALGAHDTKGDVDPEIEEVTLIKFVCGDMFFVVSTYRPETVYGVTNIWVNPKADYVICKTANGERWFLAKEAAEQLKMQFSLTIEEEVNVQKWIGKSVLTPVGGKEVPILPATFVKPDTGTGVVMSVPAHAPLDYLALRDLRHAHDHHLRKIVRRIEPKVIIKLEGYEMPARDVVERMGIHNQHDKRVEEATKEVYMKELADGVMLVPQWEGMSVEMARDKVKQMLIEDGQAVPSYIIANGPVFCRCGSKAVVNIVRDQWFIDYSNEEWKKLVHDWIDIMSILPEDEKAEFHKVVDWLKEKPCTRRRGFGTPFIHDDTQVVEPLSDSTIYPAFYTFSHLHSAEEPLSMEELNYVLYGNGEENERTKKMRESFLYWYPCDSRHSATDLVWNHLTFYLFNHVAVFPREFWPRQIVVNAFVLMNGQKMSKSLGNIMPLRDAIKVFGADTIRMTMISGAELDGDTDFNKSVAFGVRSRLQVMLEWANKYGKEDGDSPIDKWLLSRLHRRLCYLISDYEKLDLRRIAKEFFYDMYSDVQWYLKRVKEPKMKTFMKHWMLALAPIIPHTAEEIWEVLGEKPFISLANIDVYDPSFVNENMEIGEEIVKQLVEDINKVIKLRKMKPTRIRICVAPQWKRIAYRILARKQDIGSAVERAKRSEDLQPYLEQVPAFLGKYAKKRFNMPDILDYEDEKQYLEQNTQFFSSLFGCDVVVEDEGSKPAYPSKPAIIIE